MKYFLILLVFASCNSSQERAEPIAVNTSDSSLQLIIDSTAMNIDSLVDKFETAQNKIDRLENERAALLKDLGDNDAPVRYMALKALRSDTSSKTDYSGRIAELEREVASLKRRIATDSSYIARMNKTASPMEVYIEKPNDNSLIVQPVPSNNIDVYLIPYSKKAKKNLMVYEASCDLSLINKFDGKLLSTYKGQHFLNDIPPGKYIIKFCTYFGNYMVFERTNEKQVIALQTSPPLK